MLSDKDNQRELFELVCARLRAGEGVEGRFFTMHNTCLFPGGYKYWLMTHRDEVDLDEQDCVLNRSPLYRDRRDFVIQPGDSGKAECYPAKPAASNGAGNSGPRS